MNSSVVESQRQTIAVGTNLGGRLACVQAGTIRVPDYYWHNGYFDRFRRSLGESLVCDDERIVHEQYCPRTTPLHSNQDVQVSLWRELCGPNIWSNEVLSIFRSCGADFVGVPGMLLIRQSELWQTVPHNSWVVAPIVKPRMRGHELLVPAMRRTFEEDKNNPPSLDGKKKMVEVTHLGLLDAVEPWPEGSLFPMFRILTGRR